VICTCGVPSIVSGTSVPTTVVRLAPMASASVAASWRDWSFTVMSMIVVSSGAEARTDSASSRDVMSRSNWSMTGWSTARVVTTSA
jgi:hypothetical protein